MLPLWATFCCSWDYTNISIPYRWLERNARTELPIPPSLVLLSRIYRWYAAYRDLSEKVLSIFQYNLCSLHVLYHHTYIFL